MTKKDYIALARTLAKVRPQNATRKRQWTADVRAIASVLQTDNPQFDGDRFEDACHE